MKYELTDSNATMTHMPSIALRQYYINKIL